MDPLDLRILNCANCGRVLLGDSHRWVAQLMGYPSDWCDLPTETLSRLTGTRSSRRSSLRGRK